MIKRGEHGALLMTADELFALPALPLEDVYDPTGAGDTFAGGFMGYLSAVDTVDSEHLRQAMVVGSVMASATVQGFSVENLASLSGEDIAQRYEAFRELCRFGDFDPQVMCNG